VITNLGTVIGALRAHGYTGPLVVGFYNSQVELLPGCDGLQADLNAVFEGYIPESVRHHVEPRGPHSSAPADKPGWPTQTGGL